jgi:SAM-dependent methyltransferase
MLRGLVGPFSRFLEQAGTQEVLDLGAGAGGPACILAREIARSGRRPPRFVLTDLEPRVAVWERARAAMPGVLDFEPAPVDATRIPSALGAGRARMVVNVLHHFPPPLVGALLADAVGAGSRGIFIAECFERNPLRVLPLAPAWLAALSVNPLASERRRLAKALLTWATPIALAASVWDGLVSSLRVHTEAELRALAARAGGSFDWTSGTFAYPFGGRGTYFYGVPR